MMLFRIDTFVVASQLNRAAKTGGEFHQLRRGARMQTEFVDDGYAFGYVVAHVNT